MTDKFFLFRRAEPSVFSDVFSNDGNSISALSIPASHLSYMVAKEGSIVLFFNNATPYEENSLKEGQSFEKTNVQVSCKIGDEANLMEGIMNFISRKESSKAIMRFDFISINNTFKESTEPTITKVPSIPVNRGTMRSENVDGAVIAGIDFRATENLPIADYNELATGVTNTNDGADISAWQNASLATGGSGYDLSSDSGSRPVIQDPNSSISTKYSYFYDLSDQKYFTLASDINLNRDFTVYFACYVPPSIPFDAIFSNAVDGSETSYGPFTNSSLSELIVQFDDSTQEAIKAKSSYEFPYQKSLTENSETSLHVFVIRRDVDKNVIFYDKYGEVAAFIKTSNYTDGSLVVNSIGSVRKLTKMSLARIGFVGKDLGDEHSRSIAQSLYERYKV